MNKKDTTLLTDLYWKNFYLGNNNKRVFSSDSNSDLTGYVFLFSMEHEHNMVFGYIGDLKHGTWWKHYKKYIHYLFIPYFLLAFYIPFIYGRLEILFSPYRRNTLGIRKVPSKQIKKHKLFCWFSGSGAIHSTTTNSTLALSCKLWAWLF